MKSSEPIRASSKTGTRRRMRKMLRHLLETVSGTWNGFVDLMRDPVWQGIAVLVALAIVLVPLIRSKIRGRLDNATVSNHAAPVVTPAPTAVVQQKLPTSAPPANQWFDGHVYQNLPEARKEAARRGLPLFVVIYDGEHPKRSRIYYSLTHFLDYQTVKNLVRENFVQVLVDYHNEGVSELVPSDDPLENCRLVVIAPDGGVLRSEGVYANPDVALERVRQDVSRLAGDST